MYKEVVEKGLREVDNEVDKKINFLGRKHGRGDDAWSKAGAVTSGDYSRPRAQTLSQMCAGFGSMSNNGLWSTSLSAPHRDSGESLDRN